MALSHTVNPLGLVKPWMFTGNNPESVRQGSVNSAHRFEFCQVFACLETPMCLRARFIYIFEKIKISSGQIRMSVGYYAYFGSLLNFNSLNNFNSAKTCCVFCQNNLCGNAFFYVFDVRYKSDCSVRVRMQAFKRVKCLIKSVFVESAESLSSMNSDSMRVLWLAQIRQWPMPTTNWREMSRRPKAYAQSVFPFRYTNRKRTNYA